MKCLVCDLGGSSVKYALVDENAALEHNDKVPAPLNSIDDFLETIGELYDRFKDEIEGIAVSLPGIIDVDAGIHYGSGVYTRLLEGRNVRELIQTRCPVNVSIENDGKCGALAEAWKGSLADVKDGAVLILGSGVGGGVIKDGKIHRGKNNTAGEFSFMLTGRECSMMDAAWMSVGMLGITYKTCKLKNLDFSVQDVGNEIAGFDEVFRNRYPKFKKMPEKIKADGRQFFKWLEEGDKDVESVYGEFLNSLAIMVENIQICHAPDRIVLGGGLSRVERLLPDLRNEVRAVCSACGIADSMRAELCRSEYLDEGNLLGAMYNYIQQYGG